MISTNYHEEVKFKETIRLRELIKELPPFINEFFIGTSQTTSVKTRLGYARDLKIFFEYILKNQDCFLNKTMKDFSLSDLSKIDSDNIEMFMEYLTYYTKESNIYNGIVNLQNDENGKARKLAAIRSMYKFFYKRKKIPLNPASIVDSPKIHQKNIIRLESDEISMLLDEVESGKNLTKKQKMFHKINKKRDLAIITLFLGTGMRVSECVGINISDIDFKTNAIKITRKGGNQSIIYFGDEVKESLLDYIKQRNEIKDIIDENALFLSMQKKRITVRSIENLVKKYSKLTVPFKNISPHKLRSTYGTKLYNETGDIYLVAAVLGHADVNTTKKHYAHIEEERKKNAVKFIKLRRD